MFLMPPSWLGSGGDMGGGGGTWNGREPFACVF
jgi:hypothetical protein